jgi:hypothetical protein|tara:strand:- start:2932 stop:3672 length:741 start_codon:yes stop_codon:yes gene_type:complete
MSTTGYAAPLDQQTLQMACKYSIMAYEDEIPNAVKIESKWTSTTAYYIKGTEKTPDILAFRGTAQGIDWVTDALVIPVPFAGRLCHGGFTLAFLSVWGKIKKQLRMDHPLLICGHSLGGALAELAASKLHKKHKRASLCTFGKPNTFFKGFKRPMKLTRQVSCVSGSDIVARIPRFCYGPSVSQTILYFANDGKDHVNPPAELKRDDFMAAKTDAISDHFMEGYQKRLTAYFNPPKKSKKRGKKNA